MLGRLTWDTPLGEINQRLASINAPALSALVVLKATGRPGGAFWGCAPNVPPRPKKESDQDTAWVRIYTAVIGFDWPPVLPPNPRLPGRLF